MVSDNERSGKLKRDPLLRNFLDYLRVEKGLADLTVDAYKLDVEQFESFLSARRRKLDQAKREDVRGFLSQLFSNGVKDRSVARKLSTLRHFYKYLILDRIIKHDPTLEIDSPKQWKVLPKSLARTEVNALLEKAGDREGYLSTAKRSNDRKLA